MKSSECFRSVVSKDHEIPTLFCVMTMFVRLIVFFVQSLRSQEKQALKIVRFQRHLPLTIQIYTSCRISGVPPLQSDFYGLYSETNGTTQNVPQDVYRRRRMPRRDWFSPQNLRVSALDAARNYSVPAANFRGRIQAEGGSTGMG